MTAPAVATKSQAEATSAATAARPTSKMCRVAGSASTSSTTELKKLTTVTGVSLMTLAEYLYALKERSIAWRRYLTRTGHCGPTQPTLTPMLDMPSNILIIITRRPGTTTAIDRGLVWREERRDRTRTRNLHDISTDHLPPLKLLRHVRLPHQHILEEFLIIIRLFHYILLFFNYSIFGSQPPTHTHTEAIYFTLT